jgi:hypothetical protein
MVSALVPGISCRKPLRQAVGRFIRFVQEMPS